jgi:hypothetical protein
VSWARAIPAFWCGCFVRRRQQFEILPLAGDLRSVVKPLLWRSEP